MKIDTKSYYGSNFEIVIELEADADYENGEKIEHWESVMETLYERDSEGKNIWNKRLGTDVSDDAMYTYSTIVSEMTEHREKPYDNSELIMTLFEKLTDEQKMEMMERVYDNLPGDGCDQFYKKLHRDNTLYDILRRRRDDN